MPNMPIIAHKGYSLKFPENSIKAFNEAIKENCDGIELDINLDENNKYVIWHDKVSTNFIEKMNLNKPHNEQIIYYDDFVEYINSEKFKMLVKNNIMIRNEKFKIILDIKLPKKELVRFMTKHFPKYFTLTKNMDNIVTVVQSGIPHVFKNIKITKYRNKNKLRTSFLYHSDQYWCTYEWLEYYTNIQIFVNFFSLKNKYPKILWYKSYLCGLDMSLVDGADEIMYDYENLNLFNAIVIYFQMILFKTIGLASEINFFTVNDKYIAYLLQFIFSCSIITDNCLIFNS